MGSFLFIDWANIRLPPSKISVKKLSEQGLPIYWLKIYIFFVGLCLGSEEFVLIAIILFYKNIKSRST
jgi:hypothetical protein